MKKILKAMNEVSIIINGVRYDAIQSGRPYSCRDCDLFCPEECKFVEICNENDTIFNKSNKSFER